MAVPAPEAGSKSELAADPLAVILVATSVIGFTEVKLPSPPVTVGRTKPSAKGLSSHPRA